MTQTFQIDDHVEVPSTTGGSPQFEGRIVFLQEGWALLRSHAEVAVRPYGLYPVSALSFISRPSDVEIVPIDRTIELDEELAHYEDTGFAWVNPE